MMLYNDNYSNEYYPGMQADESINSQYFNSYQPKENPKKEYDDFKCGKINFPNYKCYPVCNCERNHCEYPQYICCPQNSCTKQRYPIYNCFPIDNCKCCCKDYKDKCYKNSNGLYQSYQNYCDEY